MTREELLKELADEAAVAERKRQTGLTQIEDIQPDMSPEAWKKAAADILAVLREGN